MSAPRDTGAPPLRLSRADRARLAALASARALTPGQLVHVWIVRAESEAKGPPAPAELVQRRAGK